MGCITRSWSRPGKFAAREIRPAARAHFILLSTRYSPRCGLDRSVAHVGHPWPRGGGSRASFTPGREPCRILSVDAQAPADNAGEAGNSDPALPDAEKKPVQWAAVTILALAWLFTDGCKTPLTVVADHHSDQAIPRRQAGQGGIELPFSIRCDATAPFPHFRGEAEVKLVNPHGEGRCG